MFNELCVLLMNVWLIMWYENI